MSKFIFSVLVLIFSFPAFAALDPHDPATWAGASADRFGCFLEKNFETKDPKFNCGLKNYVNEGDPCAGGGYYEGPTFPASKVGSVSGDIKTITLAWEAGQMQAVTVEMINKLDASDMRARFHFQNPVIRQCTSQTSCIVIEAFDHEGSGDVDCSAAAE